MSGDLSKKRKDKKKKKAMLEALQQEEYREERTNVGAIEDPEELVFQATYSGDEVPLVEDDGSGSGCLTKLTFLLLLTLLAAGVGIVFYELDIGGIKEQFGLGSVEPISTEAPIIDILAEETESAFTAEDVEEIVADSGNNLDIDPSPIETETEPVIEPETIAEPEPEPEPAAEPEPEEAEPAAEPEPEEVEPTAEPEPEVIDDIKEESSFESRLENEPTEVPEESFIMRAEREAVQDAVDQVWVLTVRCVEELRALQTIAESQPTLETVDRIRIRLEPLREELDELVRSTSESLFDGALEQAAQLERDLRRVLDDLEDARTKEAEAKDAVEEEIVLEEPVVEVEAEPTQSEGETIIDPEVVLEHAVEEEPVPEPEAELVVETATEAAVEIVEEALHDESSPKSTQTEPEASVETVVEPVVSEPLVVEPEVAEAVPEPVAEALVQPEEEVVETVEAASEPEPQVVESIVEAVAEPEPVIEAVAEPVPEAVAEPVVEVVEATSEPDIVEATSEPDVVEAIPEPEVVEVVTEAVAEPEAAEVEVAEPEAAEAEVAEAVVAEAVVAEPEVAEPEAAEAVVAEAKVAEAEVAEAEVAEAEVAQPEAAEAVVAEAKVAEAEVAEAEVAEPEAAESQVVEPVAEPEVVEAVAEPQVVEVVAEAAAQPEAVEAVVEPEIVEPEIVEPEIVEAVAEPEAAEPEVAEPAVAEPAVAEPAVAEPTVAEPAVVEPEATEPEAAKPEATEPAVEPEVVEAVAAEAVAEPEVVETAAEPEAVKPEVVEVAEAEPEVTEPEVEVVEEAKIENIEVEKESVATPEVAKTTIDQVSEEDTKTNEVPRTPVVEDVNRLVDESPLETLAQSELILERETDNAVALYTRARSLDVLADRERSNGRLEQAIFAYRAILDLDNNVDDHLFRVAALRCIDRMRFRGFHSKSIRIQQRLIARFPDECHLQNELAVGFLLLGQPESARTVLEAVLKRWPESGFAQVHYGFILKTTYDDSYNGARLMASGIATREDGVIDGRFYFHLGDALTRLGRSQEAQQVYIEGEAEGLFLSKDQRSLYNVDHLTGRPWWDKETTTYAPFLNDLELNWQSIRDEGVALLTLNPPHGFSDESENLRDTGKWQQFELFSRGRKNVNNCNKAPKTCELIESFPAAKCKRGQVKFSIMQPGTHVWPHTGPTNCRIRSHLGLVVPDGTRLRVGNVTQSWKEGKVLVFDDSFEHEVWHNGDTYRLVLIVDLWHPELSLEERRNLSPI